VARRRGRRRTSGARWQASSDRGSARCVSFMSPPPRGHLLGARCMPRTQRAACRLARDSATCCERRSCAAQELKRQRALDSSQSRANCSGAAVRHLHCVVQARHVDCCVRASVEASKLQTKRRAQKEMTMGKYFVGWLLGVPVVVLVIAYMILG
jgi:hypothetical protein